MRTLKKTLFLILLVYSVTHFGYSILRYNVFQGLSSGDFFRVYSEALEWKGSQQQSLQGANIHPPFYFWILLTLEPLFGSVQRMAFFFYLLQFPLFVVAWLLLVKAVYNDQAAPWTAYGLAAALILNFQPFLETFAQHKVEGIEFFLVCLALHAFRKKRDFLCGALTLVAANLKYLPGFLLFYFLIKREWRVVAGAVAAGGALFVFLCMVFGVRPLVAASIQHPVDLLLAHKTEGNRAEASVEMQTLSGTVNRWFARPEPGYTFFRYIKTENYMKVPHPSVAFGVAMALKLALLGLWISVIRKRWSVKLRGERWLLTLLEISLSLIMIFVVSQASRVHYAILLLPSFVIMGLLLVRHRNAFGLTVKLLFGCAYALTAMVIPGGLLNKLPPHPVWEQEYSNLYLWASLPFYGYLLLGACILLYRKGVHSLALPQRLVRTVEKAGWRMV